MFKSVMCVYKGYNIGSNMITDIGMKRVLRVDLKVSGISQNLSKKSERNSKLVPNR